MISLDIHTNESTYPIVFKKTFDDILSVLKVVDLKVNKVCIITDSNVDPLYSNSLINTLSASCHTIKKYVIPAGEESKTLDTVKDIYSFCLSNQLDRQSVIVALGGGVVGDIAGFVAATYTRGIPFVQIPTTLLAQNDSSVGGKVGVDFLNHKNMVGAFYQPRLVYMNLSALKTLPQREFNAGMAEVIKHGLIRDESFYNSLIENVDLIKSLDPEAISRMNYKSCMIKGDVVGQDEKESSLRKILNFGHTIGHAIETLSNFEYLHGECVALGMLAVSHISLGRNLITDTELEGIKNTLALYNLPTKLAAYNVDDIYNQLFYDKKVLDDKIVFILLDGIGKTIEANNVTKEEIINSIYYLQEACQ